MPLNCKKIPVFRVNIYPIVKNKVSHIYLTRIRRSQTDKQAWDKWNKCHFLL